MADTVRKVEYFSIRVPNTPAKAFGVLSTLVSSGIDLLACIGVPRGRKAQIDVVPADTRRFKSAVKKAGLSFTPEPVPALVEPVKQLVEKVRARQKTEARGQKSD